MAGHDLTLIATQTRAPLTPGRTVDRREHLQQLAHFVAGRPEAILLLGDLNATAWSPIVRDFLRTSGLHDGRFGFGLQASWPTFLPALAIPIDHALISSGVTIRNFAKGPDIGSDHYPILIDFSLPSEPETLSISPPKPTSPSHLCAVDC
jgi:endonuclease/exonuclease/phosphatase (EEP) superfamily protein YafD